MVSDGLELEGMLLSMMGWEDLVEYDKSAVTVPGREDQALTVRRPMRI